MKDRQRCVKFQFHLSLAAFSHATARSERYWTVPNSSKTVCRCTKSQIDRQNCKITGILGTLEVGTWTGINLCWLVWLKEAFSFYHFHVIILYKPKTLNPTGCLQTGRWVPLFTHGTLLVVCIRGPSRRYFGQISAQNLSKIPYVWVKVWTKQTQKSAYSRQNLIRDKSA